MCAQTGGPIPAALRLVAEEGAGHLLHVLRVPDPLRLETEAGREDRDHCEEVEAANDRGTDAEVLLPGDREEPAAAEGDDITGGGQGDPRPREGEELADDMLQIQRHQLLLPEEREVADQDEHVVDAERQGEQGQGPD